MEDLKNRQKNSDSYLAVLVGFINCLLSQPDELKDRLKIRAEFISKRE
jgi:hypothetical protein